MHLVSYRIDEPGQEPGVTRFGRVVGGKVVDGAAATAGRWSSLRQVLAEDGLAELRAATEGAEPVADLASVTLLPPVPDPGKIICAGVNYQSHREETTLQRADHPTLFTRFADSQIGHDQAALKPSGSDRFDYEGELAIVVGRPVHHLSEIDAWAAIAGYSCYNDFSVRDWQRHSSQWLPGKNFPGTGAFGPSLVTTDEVDDITASTLQTSVNGEVRQDASVGDMIFSIPALLSYISSFTRLRPGDVIVTGTPGGVGLFMEPPQFLQPGDHVEVHVSGVGSLRNTVAEA